jgi:hypothetical protein
VWYALAVKPHPRIRKTIKLGLAGTFVASFSVFLLHGCWVPTYVGQGAVMGHVVTPWTFLNIHSSDARWLYVRGHYLSDLHTWTPPYYATVPGADAIVVPLESNIAVIDGKANRLRIIPTDALWDGSHLNLAGDLAFHDDVLGLDGDVLLVEGRGGRFRASLSTGEWKRVDR